ncbi:unnamed protein product [Arabis nemorensis]|uniref:Uncharacterized protein n=1 Tax=Arabis nemorensis TaxID=586526 RepID=A0A565CQ44_9BRAS|nr:unnamed protein product [Arabis nemorensis]
MGRIESVRWGLGYQGGSGCDREGQSERIIFVKSSGATDVPQKQDGSVQSPGHICNDLGTGHSKNIKISMAAREMKTHTSSGSSFGCREIEGYL